MKSKEEKNFNSSLTFLAKSSVIVLLGMIISKIISYFYRIVIARNFGPEVYGFFSIGLMVSGLFIAVAYMGLINGLIRYISIYRGKNDKSSIRYVFKISSRFLIFTGIISFILMFLTSEFIAVNIFHNTDLINYLRGFSFVVPLTIFMVFYLSIIIAYEKVKSYSFIHHFLLNFVKFGTLILFIYLGMGINSLIFSYLIGIFIAGSALYLVAKYSIKELFEKEAINKKRKKEIAKNLFSYSWPFLFSALITSIFYWTDSFMIGFFGSPIEVGLYNVAIPLALLLTIAPELFIIMFFPLVTKEYSQKNIITIKELTKQVGKWIFMLNLPILALLIIFPEEFINLLFGSQYILAGNSLRILSIGLFFSSIFILSSKLMEVIGKSKLILLDTLIIASFNLVLNLFLVPRYGISGAALSTTLSLIILNSLFLFQAKHYISIVPLRRKMLRIFVSITLPVIIVFLISINISITSFYFILLSIFLILLYLLLLFLTKALDRNDLIIINRLKDKLNK